MRAGTEAVATASSARQGLKAAIPAAASAFLLLALAGCAAEDPGTPADGDAAPPQQETSEEDTGKDGRAFDSTDDAVITAVEAALSSYNATAEWDGSTLRVSMDGSASDPTAALHCTTIEVIVADDEDGVFVYSDGEVPCE